MNPTRWRSRFSGLPTLERVTDCGNHPVNHECPHVDAAQCQAVEHVATGLVHMGFSAEDTPFRRFWPLSLTFPPSFIQATARTP